MTQSEGVRLLVAQLCASGLRHVVISPGSRSTPLVQAIAERNELALHPALDERSAAFLALGLHRANGEWCMTLCTSGSAAAHGLPAAIEAVESGDHLIIVTADRPADVRGLGASQAILQPGLLGPYATHFVEWDVTTATHDDLTRALHAAVSTAQLRGGVVHINVPLAMPLALQSGPLPDRAAAMPIRAPDPGPALPPPVPSERTLLLLGPLPRLPGLGQFLSERLGPDVVVVAEPASRLSGVLGDCRHADLLLRDPRVREALRPQRIVRVGAWPVSKGLQLLLEEASRVGTPVDTVHPRRFSDPLRQNRVTSVEDPQSALRDWPITGDRPEGPWLRQWRDLDAAVSLPTEGWHEASIVARLATSLPEVSTLVLGNSMPVRDWHSFAPPPGPSVEVEVSRGAAGIDGTLATAIGLAIGRQHPLVAYVGDSTFLHDIGSLQIIRGMAWDRASLRVIVLDNGGGAIFDYLPARGAMPPDTHERWFTLPHHQELARLAAGFGIGAVEVGSLAELDAVLAIPLQPGEVQVVVAVVDRAAGEAMHRTHWAQVSAVARTVLGPE